MNTSEKKPALFKGQQAEGQANNERPILQRHYYLTYTIAFSAFAAVAFTAIYLIGRSLIWQADGLKQHFTFLVYIGEWLRSFAATGTLQQWEFSFGYGADIITTLATWIGEPFNLLSAFCPPSYTEYLYQFIVVLRLWLAGMTFSAFCRYHKRDSASTLIGALCYAFCGFCLCWGALRHPMFIDAAIELPLVLLGADRLMRDRKPLTLILSLALAFITYFYFAYMIVIFLALFCLMRFLFGHEERIAKRFLTLLAAYIGCGIVSAMLAAVFLLPIIAQVVSMDRISQGASIPLFYDPSEYAQILLSFMGAPERSGTAQIGLASVCAVIAFATPSLRRDPLLRQPLIAVGALILFALLPACASALNGFSYTTDRWAFAFSFALCSTVTLVLPQLTTLSKQAWRQVILASGIFEILVLTVALTEGLTTAAIEAFVVFNFFLIVIWRVGATYSQRGNKTRGCHNHANPTSKRRRQPSRRIFAALLASCLLGVFFFVNGLLALGTKPYAGELVPFGAAYGSMTTAQPNYAIADLQKHDASPYRYDEPADALELVEHNANALTGQLGINFFSSIYNQNVDTFRTQLALPLSNTIQSHLYHGSDSRAALEAVSSVKYFIVQPEASSPIPYSYDEVAERYTADKTTYHLSKPANRSSLALITDVLTGKAVSKTVTPYTYEALETARPLPLAFVYNATVAPERYEAMSPIERQQSLLQACSTTLDIGNTIEPADASREIPFTISEKSSATLSIDSEGEPSVTSHRLEGGTISCSKKNRRLILDFKAQSHTETYLYITGLRYVAPANTSLPGHVNMTFGDGDKTEKTIVCATPSSNFYSGKEDWLINLGYSDQGIDQAVITLPRKGVYTFTSLRVITLPMDDFDNRVEALAATPVNDITLSPNTISCTASVKKPSVLYFSTPYSTGWTATVDNHEVDIAQANTAFMAIKLEEGNHHIEMRYHTPGLRAGLCLSALGAAATIAIAVILRRRKEPQHPVR